MRGVKTPRKLLYLSYLLAAGCGGATASRPVAAGPQGPADVLGAVNGVPVHVGDIPPDGATRLRELDDDYAQRRFQLLWAGMEEVVADRLLAAEAKRRNMDLGALLKEEVDSKVGAPSEEEIRGLYDANRELIQVPFSAAARYLKEQWHLERVQALRRGLVDRLRQGADVRYALPPPEMTRLPVEPKGPSAGPKDARVTVVIFSDFQCPYSAQARRLLYRLRDLYPQTLRIVHRDFPLDQHPLAQGAAEAAHCADEQGKFWAYYDVLFENTTALEAADLKRYATQAELDAAAFDTCLASERPKKAVAEDQEAGKRFGVRGTPALFVNGMRLIGILPLPLMQSIIDQELERH
jgi:protein-disulfide isomerase